MTPLDPAILAAILAEPDDDFHLVPGAADWWEQHGEGDRAEFVRVQVELAGLIGKQGNPPGWLRRAAKLRRRERELLDNFNDLKWAGEPLNRTGDFALSFQRGFVDWLECSWNAWSTHADAITAQQPIRRVRLTSWPNGNGLNPLEQATRSLTERTLTSHWPRIEFELPTPWQHLAATPDGTDIYFGLAEADITTRD